MTIQSMLTRARSAVADFIREQVTCFTMAQKKHAAVAMTVFMLLNMNKIRTGKLPLLSAAIVAAGVASNSHQITTVVNAVKAIFSNIRSRLAPGAALTTDPSTTTTTTALSLPKLVLKMNELANQVKVTVDNHNDAVRVLDADAAMTSTLEAAIASQLTSDIKPTFDALKAVLGNPFVASEDITTVIKCLEAHKKLFEVLPEIAKELDDVLSAAKLQLKTQQVRELTEQAKAILNSGDGSTDHSTKITTLLQLTYQDLLAIARGGNPFDTEKQQEAAIASLQEHRALFNHIPGAADELDALLKDNPVYNMGKAVEEAQHIIDGRDATITSIQAHNAQRESPMEPRLEEDILQLHAGCQEQIATLLTPSFNKLIAILEDVSSSQTDRDGAIACLKQHRTTLEQVDAINARLLERYRVLDDDDAINARLLEVLGDPLPLHQTRDIVDPREQDVSTESDSDGDTMTLVNADDADDLFAGELGHDSDLHSSLFGQQNYQPVGVSTEASRQKTPVDPDDPFGGYTSDMEFDSDDSTILCV